MSEVANRRAFLKAAHELVTVSVPNERHILTVLQTLGACLSDLFDEPVIVVPQPAIPNTTKDE